MNTKDRAKNFSNKYGIKVLALDDKLLIYEYKGYKHKVNINNISHTDLESTKTLLPLDYINYLNNSLFKESPLEVISIDYDILTIVNNETKVMTTTKRNNIHIDTLLNATNKTNKYKEAIIEALGTDYLYDKCFPTKVSDKVVITCPIHGDFQVSVNNAIHLKSGCPLCANEYRGYSRSTFVKACIRNNEKGDGTLYVIKVVKDEESFIKVGITSFPSLQDRLKELHRLGCEVEEILIKQGWAKDVYNLEKYIHRYLSCSKHIPSFAFNGRQECYNLDILPKIIEIIRKRWKNTI
jgi:hypothetical protein